MIDPGQRKLPGFSRVGIPVLEPAPSISDLASRPSLVMHHATGITFLTFCKLRYNKALTFFKPVPG